MALKGHASVDLQHGPELKEQEPNDRGSITHRILAASDPTPSCGHARYEPRLSEAMLNQARKPAQHLALGLKGGCACLAFHRGCALWCLVPLALARSIASGSMT